MPNALVHKPQGAKELVVEAGGRISVKGALGLPEATPVNAVASTLTTELTGTNNDLVFTAKAKGVAGDDITVAYVAPAEDAELSVAVAGKAITVNLAFATDAITTTAANIKTAIEASTAAAALVTVASAADNDGSGVVTAMEATHLDGGVDGTVALEGDMYRDASYLYVAVADNTVADGNWRRISLGSAY